MRVYGLKTCDTCRKALKSLEGSDFIDVRAQGVPDAVLAQALKRFGEALLNTRSTTWRGLDAEQRKKEPLELLQEHPTLMKRPLVEKDGALYLGWTAETQAALGVG
ncbi:ArsC/Spx/MgsR family protein [Ruegeria faecimaris]|uniref:Arsenate reductase n=1 Tax=Ruegeria faecimaris TaxID=686389 RepID=A0A521AH36_9RHOB|nr:ArsC/Spx/MgsR family protein [Ruegeria faecimaris]SMO34112.1 arsenate reductase [Ruegeria faecimaris]